MSYIREMEDVWAVSAMNVQTFTSGSLLHARELVVAQTAVCREYERVARSCEGPCQCAREQRREACTRMEGRGVHANGRERRAREWRGELRGVHANGGERLGGRYQRESWLALALASWWARRVLLHFRC